MTSFRMATVLRILGFMFSLLSMVAQAFVDTATMTSSRRLQQQQQQQQQQRQRRPLAAASTTAATTTNDMAFTEEELVAMTKEYLAKPSPDWWADDFVFRGPVIGPLTKTDIINTLTAVGPEASFEDFTANAFGFAADPVEPNRVWWMVRPRGTFAQAYQHPVLGTIEPTHQALVAPPEARSIVWNANGKIRYQSVGYVTDRFTGDTTDGMGAVFGLYHHMGVSIDGSVGSPVTRLLQWLSSEILPEGTLPKSYSKEKDVPEWWTDKRKGAES